MSIQLKLDTAALSALIEKDEEFKFSLQQAVIQNVADRYVKVTNSSIESILERAASEMREKILDRWSTKNTTSIWGASRKLTDSVKEDIIELIDKEVSEQIKKSTDNNKRLIDDAIKNALDRLDVNYINKKIDVYLNKYTNEYVAAEIEKRFKAAMKQLTVGESA